MEWVFATMEWALVIVVIIGLICFIGSCNKRSNTTTQTAQIKLKQQQNIARNMICPHCQTRGSVTTQQVKRKSGIHGGKATAAILTCGVSMLGTGLSRKQQVTEAHCSKCGANWTF